MSKKWPRNGAVKTPDSVKAAMNKLRPVYWQRRLFKNSYSYKGKRIEVNNWAVKIQHQGQRKTFSLRATNPRRAAREACDLYRAILGAGGLEGFASPWARRTVRKYDEFFESSPSELKVNPQYWEQRLIHREYGMKPPANANSHYAVRIDHEGSSSYFPLGTSERSKAAARALRIFQTIQRQEIGRAHV